MGCRNFFRDCNNFNVIITAVVNIVIINIFIVNIIVLVTIVVVINIIITDIAVIVVVNVVISNIIVGFHADRHTEAGRKAGRNGEKQEKSRNLCR